MHLEVEAVNDNLYQLPYSSLPHVLPTILFSLGIVDGDLYISTWENAYFTVVSKNRMLF
jgi:hypothetical protein